MSGRREQAKARTREAIIEAGIRLMAERGYDATSTTAIARAAGVSPATLFNYFPTKASILFADDHLWAPPPGPLDPSVVGATPRETLVALVLALLDQPAWTRPADDPLTTARFELVRREPALRDAQILRAFARVPELADACRAAHPGLNGAAALAEAGAVVGAVLSAVTWGDRDDLRARVTDALRRL